MGAGLGKGSLPLTHGEWGCEGWDGWGCAVLGLQPAVNPAQRSPLRL